MLAEQNKQTLVDFLAGARQLALPFTLDLGAGSSLHSVKCSEIFRLLPGKRLVVKASSEQQQLLVKIFATANKGRHQFNKELAGYAWAQAAGVNVPMLIGAYPDQEQYCAIAYQFIPDAILLSDPTIRSDQAYLAKCFAMIANMHHYGIVQQDLHLDNILVNNERVYLLDLGSVHCEVEAKPLSKGKSLDNLALFVAQFYPIEQARLMNHLPQYYQARGWAYHDDEQACFTDKVSQAWDKRKRNYLSKCLRNCSNTEYQQSFWQRYAFRRASLESEAHYIVDHIEQFINQGDKVKLGNSATVVKVEIASKTLIIKRYNYQNIWQLLKRCWRPSRAVISWRNAHLLELIGLATPRPIAFVENRIGWFTYKAYFISEYLASEQLLTVYQRRQPNEGELAQMSTIFRLLHDHKISHGDFKAQNLLLDQQGNVALIDLDSLREHKSKRAFSKAFAKDKKRFLQNWQDAQIKQMMASLIAPLT